MDYQKKSTVDVQSTENKGHIENILYRGLEDGL